jgi:hypothetical protein
MWNQGQPSGPAEVLRLAMTQQGQLKVMALCGDYFDVHREEIAREAAPGLSGIHQWGGENGEN